MKKFYSTTEVAEMLKVPRLKVYRMVKAGKLKAELQGGSWMIPAREVEKVVPWLTKEK